LCSKRRVFLEACSRRFFYAMFLKLMSKHFRKQYILLIEDCECIFDLVSWFCLARLKKKPMLFGYIKKTQTFLKIDRSRHFEEESFMVSCLVHCYLYISLCITLMLRTCLFSWVVWLLFVNCSSASCKSWFVYWSCSPYLIYDWDNHWVVIEQRKWDRISYLGCLR